MTRTRGRTALYCLHALCLLVLGTAPLAWLGCGTHPVPGDTGRAEGTARPHPAAEALSRQDDPRASLPPRPDRRAYHRDQAFPALEDEVWVIARDPGPVRKDEQADRADAPPDGEQTTAPALARVDEQTDDLTALPLAHTDVHADITGHVATVRMNQRYFNPYDGRIEAVYAFPLPQHAAVNGFTMTMGARRIHGIIRPREKAEEIYYEARARGHRASLLTEERPNIFTQRVANIEPKQHIDIDIRYFHTLSYRNGDFEFVVPMVVGPRHNPPGADDGIEAAAAGTTEPSRQPARVTYLKPGERSGHGIDLRIDVDAGRPIAHLESPTHNVSIDRPGDSRAVVRLNAEDRIPNRDFILRIRPEGADTRAMMFAQPPRADARGAASEWGYFSMLLLPPDEAMDLPRRPIEWVFAVDTSATMNGEPLAAAQAALLAALDRMEANDSFELIRFGERIERFASEPKPADRPHRREAERWVKRLSARGEVDLVAAVEEALSGDDAGRDENTTRASGALDEMPPRRIVAILTDGLVSNEAEVLAMVSDRLGESGLFSFGIGAAPNRFLAERMGRLGRGAVAYVPHAEQARDTMDAFMKRAARPALTDIDFDFGAMAVRDLTPEPLADLYAGRPVIVSGRFKKAHNPPRTVSVTGHRGDDPVELEATVHWHNDAGRRPSLDAAWARHRIADAHDRALVEGRAVDARFIETLALDYALVSAWTAMVAVDGSGRPTGRHGTTLEVPVPTPEGLRGEAGEVNDELQGR